MRALILDADGLSYVEDRPRPEPGPDEALVRVRLAGICGTDLELLGGYAGFEGVPGHEFVGLVERCDASPERVGQRVVGEINVSCGACSTCRVGRRTHCPWRVALGIRGHDGAFAEYVCLPERNLHQVPGNVTDEAAVLAEPVAAACRIVEQTHVDEGVVATVVGDGRLGLLVAQVLLAHGARVTLLGRHPDKLDRVSHKRLTTATDPSTVKPCGLVVECTGTPGGLDTALTLVRPTGKVVVKSTCAGESHHGIDVNRLVVDEISLVGSRCGPLRPALDLLQRKQIDANALIDDRLPLSEGVRAFERAAEPGVVKVLLAP